MLNVKMRPLKEKLVKKKNRAYSENAMSAYRSLENEEWYD